MLEVRENQMYMRMSFFHLLKRWGKSELFSIHAQTAAETSQPQAQPIDDWPTIGRVCPWGLHRPWKKFGSARLSWKKANFVHRKKLLLRGYKFKKTKHERCGKRPAATEEIDDGSTEADMNALRRSIELLLFFFQALRFSLASSLWDMRLLFVRNRFDF